MGVVFDETRGRYIITPNRFAVALEAELGIQVNNHSRMGAVVTEGYQRFVKSPIKPGGIVVVAYGGNDCDMPWKAVCEDPDALRQARTPLPLFIQTLFDFVKAIRDQGMPPLLVTRPPLDANRYFDWVTRNLSKEVVLRYLGDVAHIYRWQERYAIAVRNVAQAAKCALFDARDAFLEDMGYLNHLCVDGIHINEDGHALITRAIVAQRENLSESLTMLA